MGLFGNKEKTSTMTVKTPREVFTDILKVTSGSGYARDIDFDIFYQIVAFKGCCDGVGVSTLVANTALAIAKLGLTVCVIDSSVTAPVQDILLKTNWKNKDLDWFDIMYTDDSVLNQSRLNSNISVLSFKGKKRDITDIMGTKDSDLLVETAISVLHNKFDIILIDCCQELTQINAGCLQQSQKVIQVWSDAPHIISNIDMSITNNVILSCPMDKMRYVVVNKYTKGVLGNNFDDMLHQYRFTKLASCCLSSEIAKVVATGKELWAYPSTDNDIIEFNNCIVDIVCHLLNIEDNKSQARGTITSNDIMDGKVEGTLHAKLKKKEESEPKVYKSMEEIEDAEQKGKLWKRRG